jgi:hypothetical protein
MPDGLLTIEGLLEILEKADPASAFFHGAAELLNTHLAPGPEPQAPASRPTSRPLLTIGMPTFNDYDGVYFSVQALRLYHPEITADTEILILDNDPHGPSAAGLKRLEGRVAGYRYFPYESFTGTTVKDLVFREAAGAFVLVMDSHILFPPGSLKKFIDFLTTQSTSIDLWQGPLLSDELKPIATHFDSVWSGGMHGQWGWDERASDIDAEPFEIPMQGMGVFACRREAWPGFNPRFQGFCCEEGYIQEKIRRQGGKALCLPFLRWLHRFERPAGIPYRPIWEDRIRNYFIRYSELGADTAELVQHFHAELGDNAGRIFDAARREIAGPFHQYDAVFAVGGDRARWNELTGSRVRFIEPAATSHPEIGRVLAHRKVLDEAVWQNLRSILVLEGPPVHAVEYGCADFPALLQELPHTAAHAALWLRKGGSLEALGRTIPMGIAVQVFGCTVDIVCGCQETLALLDRYIFPRMPRVPLDPWNATMTLWIWREPGGFRVDCAGQDEVVTNTQDLLVSAIRILDEQLLKLLKGFIAIHAGAVEIAGKVLLLPGRTHAGKSSLVAELIRRGAVYFSDEFALIDSQGRAHSYPRPLMLRQTGSDRQVATLPQDLCAITGAAPAPIAWILGLKYCPDSDWNVAATPQSEALLMLLRNTPSLMAEDPSILESLGRAVAGARCLIGGRGEAAAAAEAIFKLAAE